MGSACVRMLGTEPGMAHLNQPPPLVINVYCAHPRMHSSVEPEPGSSPGSGGGSGLGLGHVGETGSPLARSMRPLHVYPQLNLNSPTPRASSLNAKRRTPS